MCPPFLRRKPSDALGDPWPQTTPLPKITQGDGTGDYESELAVVIGADCKNVDVEHAMDYVLGYTAANDVSSRGAQFAQSQWCYSKGFDGSCPIGRPLFFSLLFDLVCLRQQSDLFTDMDNSRALNRSHNRQQEPGSGPCEAAYPRPPQRRGHAGLRDRVSPSPATSFSYSRPPPHQKPRTDPRLPNTSWGVKKSDLIFDVPKIVSFLSQGTTLRAGTVIVTGTPAGVGAGRSPKVAIKHGDVFSVEILPHVGTLFNKFENEA